MQSDRDREYEFPTVGQIAHAQELRGAEVVRVHPGPDGSITADRFVEAIDDRTALVCCTTLSFRTGHRHDVPAIAEAAHAHGAIVLADSYQALGAVSSMCGHSGPTSSRAAPSSTSSARRVSGSCGCVGRCSRRYSPPRPAGSRTRTSSPCRSPTTRPRERETLRLGHPHGAEPVRRRGGHVDRGRDGRAGDRDPCARAQHPPDRAAGRHRRHGRHADRPGSARAAGLRPLDGRGAPLR